MNNKNLVIGLVVLLVVIAVWYSMMNKSGLPAQPTTGNQAVPSKPTSSTVTLSTQNGSSESGTATLTEVNGKVKVTLKLTGAAKDVVQPAHIHVGSCPSVGAVKYGLTSPVNGVSETMLDVSLDQLRSEQPLGINVHKSNAESQVYVSCGNLNL